MTFQVTNPVVNFNIWDATQTTNDDNTVSFTASYFMKNGANFAVCVTNSFGSTGPSAGLSGTGANTDVIPLAARIRAKMLGYLRENFPTVQTLACMAYTGFEHVKPVSAEDFARENTAIYGMDLAVVRNPNKTYLEMVEKRGMFPSMSTRQCTSDLKRGPIETWTRRQVKSGVITAKIIINCTGIRAAESPARSKQIPWSVNDMNFGGKGKDLTPAAALFGHTVHNWMPVFMDTFQDVLQWHWNNGVALHPVYVPEYHHDGTQGGYLRRLSCRVCIFSTKADLRAIYVHDNDAFIQVALLGQRIGFTMQSGKSLFQIIQEEPAGDDKQFGLEEEGFACAA
jgi:3'-phosphoadenosine 5'-phosphosulfate sulfotransferase (PAPS reductase)/FAD synthetase